MRSSSPPALIKINMKLLRDIYLSRLRSAIVASIAQLARHLGVGMLAEGIECAEELTVLRACGISVFQGYHFARPAVAALPRVAG